MIVETSPQNEHDFLAFDFLIDGLPISQILEDGNEGIPFWLATEGIPTLPLKEKTSTRRIISVCNCGEYGCGSSNCDIEIKDKEVIFKNFEGDCGDNGQTLVFTFNRTEFDQEISKMIKSANKALERNSEPLRSQNPSV